MIFLTTDRLLLRSLEPQDAQVMYDYRNHESCARYQRGQTKDREGIRALVERHRDDVLSLDAPCIVAVTLKQTGEMVGEIVVMPSDRTISLGYTISNRHHRKDYALEALSALIEHLHRQALDWEWICFVEPENTPSISLLKKLGYQDLGYIPSKDSLAFGKWVKEDTVEEFRRASQRGGKGREE